MLRLFLRSDLQSAVVPQVGYWRLMTSMIPHGVPTCSNDANFKGLPWVPTLLISLDNARWCAGVNTGGFCAGVGELSTLFYSFADAAPDIGCAVI